ncbi:MAG: T9SS type A sorting domain-containing protein, partial [Bacteroidetes bacterium]|nr:T9SS type A sorting domain-containing protein [Bacteroidota bacterium]
MKTLIIIVFIAILTDCICHGQSISPEVISSGGGEYENAYASISITIGEPVTETISNGTITLTQGFQQGAIEILVIEESKMPEITVNLYPNPATDNINLVIVSEGNEIFSYQLCDNSGKITKSENVTRAVKSDIDISGLAQGQYYLRIICENIGYSKT